MRKICIFNLLLVAGLLTNCRKDDYNDDLDKTPEIIKFTGDFAQNDNDPVPLSDLTVQSVISKTPVSDDGKFTLESMDNTKYQFFIATSNVSGEITYYGISDPGTGKVLINDSTTALGLLLMNPYLFGSEQQQRKEFAQQVAVDPEFSDILDLLAAARIASPHDPLNAENHPEIHQLATEVMITTFEKLGAGGSDTKLFGGLIEIIDGPGNQVIFDNYRHIYYGVDIVYPSSGSSNSVLLSRKEKLIEWVWWPLRSIGPRFIKPARTYADINDGFMNMSFLGFKLDKIGTDVSSARDRASIYNLCYGIFYTLDMIIGVGEMSQKFDAGKIGTLLQGSPELLSIQAAIIEKDNVLLINSVINLLVSDVGMEIVQNIINVKMDAKFISKSVARMNVAVKICSALGYLNEHIPFFIDLCRNPKEWDVSYTSVNGILTKINENGPPEIDILFSPQIGYKVSEVLFNAEYTDDFTPASQALYSWKWVEEGGSDNDVWSVPSSNRDTLIVLSSPGMMYLRVDDRTGGVTLCSKRLPFFESLDKERIIVLTRAQVYPYYHFMIDSMKLCDAECFDNPRFELVSPYIIDAPSNMFDPAILNPATDLLIIHPALDDNYPSPDGMGPSNFIIDSFLKHRLAIMNFVRAGGNLLYISDSHLNISSLPSMFMTKLSYSLTITAAPSSNRNFINETSASINTSLAFTAPPPGSLIHLLNSTGDPVLFETESGKGTILISAFSPLCNTGSPPGSPIHYPVNINTIRYMIGAVYK